MGLWFLFRPSPACYVYYFHGVTVLRLPVRWYMRMLNSSQRSNQRVHLRNEVGMISATASPGRFQVSGKVTLARILQTLWFPGSAAFHRRVADFRLRVAVYTMLHSYTYATPLCVCVCRPDFTGHCNCGAGPRCMLIQLPTLTLPRYTWHVLIACV